MKLGTTLPYLLLDVSEGGVTVSAAPENDNPRFETGPYSIDCVSYGVQVGQLVNGSRVVQVGPVESCGQVGDLDPSLVKSRNLSRDAHVRPVDS